MIPRRPGRYEDTEPCESTVPADLIPAVKHLRKSFEDAHWGFGRTSQKFCYAALHRGEIDDPAKEHFNYLMYMKARVGGASTQRFHDLFKQATPSAIFKAFFDLYLDGVTVQVLLIFKELAAVGQANHTRLPANYLEWAEAQTNCAIRSEVHRIPMWVRSVCDVQVDDPKDDEDEWIYWRKWQAPMFLIMKPSRYRTYDAEEAWDRKDTETSSRWLEMFADQYVLRLKNQVRDAAGDAAVEQAKKGEQVDSEIRVNPVAPIVNPTTAIRPVSTSARREARKVDSQDRYKRWQKKYRELKRDRPEMSDVWFSQQIARLAIAEHHSAETIRKHMTKK